MDIQELSKELKLLQEELACMRAAEQHIQDKIDLLLTDLNEQLIDKEQVHEVHHIGDLTNVLRRFEVQHPDLTDNLNRVFVTLGNMGI
ncbi:MAG: hypothetical protein ACI93R_000787 [Flavobacteriales bacterium]|jgi:hypothetical protein